MPAETVRIPLRRHDGSVRAWTIVDAADHAGLSNWKWHLANGYAVRNVVDGVEGRTSQTTLRMSRALLGLGADQRVVDHVNGDTLDNRRRNLRAVTHQANSCNRGARGRGTSVHRGVSWKRYRSGRGAWSARARLHGELIYLGVFERENDAAAAVHAFWEAAGHPVVERAVA